MEIPKDMYEYLTNFADDKTILNMLSVNKQFRDEKFFERVLERKYPMLMIFKKEGQSWRDFYIKMTYYISKLEEDYDIPYIPSIYFNPEGFFEEYYRTPDSRRRAALFYATNAKRLDIVNKLLYEGVDEDKLYYSLVEAVKINSLEIIKELLDYHIFELNEIYPMLYLSEDLGYKNISKYLEEYIKLREDEDEDE